MGGNAMFTNLYQHRPYTLQFGFFHEKQEEK